MTTWRWPVATTVIPSAKNHQPVEREFGWRRAERGGVHQTCFCSGNT
jgi:hypothetical protein